MDSEEGHGHVGHLAKRRLWIVCGIQITQTRAEHLNFQGTLDMHCLL